MNRELNPHLFGPPPAYSPRPGERAGLDPASAASPQIQESTPVPAIPVPRAGAGAAERAQGSAYFPLELKALETNVQGARAQMASMEQKTEALAVQVGELARSVNARLERFSSALKRLEEAQAQQAQDFSAKNAVLAGKVNERKVNDNKILDLIERHNILVRNFENRLVALQRTLSEQELQLHASSAALEEARDELAKIKRG
jgi:septation ring formation regulator EzrA